MGWGRGSLVYNLYTIKGQYDRLVETPPEVRPRRRDGVDGEDFWAGEGSLKSFHVCGRGILFSNPLAEIPAIFFKNAYSTCLQAACPSL